MSELIGDFCSLKLRPSTPNGRERSPLRPSTPPVKQFFSPKRPPSPRPFYGRSTTLKRSNDFITPKSRKFSRPTKPEVRRRLFNNPSTSSTNDVLPMECSSFGEPSAASSPIVNRRNSDEQQNNSEDSAIDLSFSSSRSFNFSSKTSSSAQTSSYLISLNEPVVSAESPPKEVIHFDKTRTLNNMLFLS